MTQKPLEPAARILSLSHDGRGIAHIQNKTTFISNALPNETVHYAITHQHTHYNEAKTLAIITPSPERRSPPCEHFSLCGGCSLQHMSTNLQIQYKQQTLLEQLQCFGHVTPQTLLAPLTVKSTHYRRKARLGAKFVLKKIKC